MNDDKLRDIHGFHPIEVPVWLYYLLALSICILLVYFIYREFFRKQETIQLIILDLTIEALNELDVKSKSKDFYLAYTEIVKAFLEKEFALQIMDKTVEELRPIMESSPYIKTSQSHFLHNVMSRSDLAKFAQHEITIEQKSNDLQSTISIIKDIYQEKNIQETLKANELSINQS